MPGERRMFIGGEWVASQGGAAMEATAPATGEVIGSVPEGTRADVGLAVEAARRASAPWSSASAFDRAAAMRRIATVIDSRRESLARTLTLSLDSVFGDRDVALRSAGRINAAHASVRGEGYSAFDPDLLLWVFATLADSAVLSYELFVRRLTTAEKDAYYDETLHATQVLGLRRALAPSDFAGLREYVSEQIASGAVRVDDTGYAMAQATLYPPNARFVPRPAFDAGAFITAALLPPELRTQFRLPWSLRHQAAFEVFVRLVRGGVPLLPSTLRHVPQARAARRRVA